MRTFSDPTADRYQDWMASLKVQGSTITGNVKRALYLHLTRTCLEKYLESKHIIGHHTYLLIFWPAICKAQGFNKNQDIRITKLICNQLPTMQILHWRKHATTDKCPYKWRTQHIYTAVNTQAKLNYGRNYSPSWLLGCNHYDTWSLPC